MYKLDVFQNWGYITSLLKGCEMPKDPENGHWDCLENVRPGIYFLCSEALCITPCSSILGGGVALNAFLK